MASSNIFLVPQEETGGVPRTTDRVVLLQEAETSGYRFDAVTRYTANYGTRPTRHSVPSGNTISDHAIRDPRRFSLTGIITPHAITLPDINNIFGSVALSTADKVINFDKFSGQLTTAREAAVDAAIQRRREIIAFHDAKRLFTVILPEDIIANMMIASLAFPKSSNMGDGFMVNVGMSEVRIAPRTQVQPDIISEDARKLGGLGFLEIEE